MVKYCLDKYPLGSVPNQKTAGRYMDGYLYDNLKTLVEVIKNDMTFLAFVFSSTLEVGTGKSVLASQVGECWSELIKQLHNEDVPFTATNLVFKPKDLIERSFKVPKYSCIILDEWEDAHYWSELGMSLRMFFRKCRQLNLFMLCIIPNFFELPRSYAISRSVFAIDVRFEGKFERGYFKFYNFDRKKQLYIKGKKEQNYSVVPCNFSGRFLDGYGIPEEEYRKAKRKDMDDYDEKKNKPIDKTAIHKQLVKDFRKKLPDLTCKDLAFAFGVSERTISRWINDEDEDNDSEVSVD